MKIQLSEHFTYKKLLRFVLPSIIMMIFTSIYGIVDGLFVSNYVGKTAFAAVNLVMPLMMGVSALGFMVGTGGSAIVAKTLGEGEHKKANEYFSLLVYVTFIGGVIFSLCGMLLVRPVASLLGAEGALLDNCVLYGRICFISMPAFGESGDTGEGAGRCAAGRNPGDAGTGWACPRRQTEVLQVFAWHASAAWNCGCNYGKAGYYPAG